MSQRFAAIAALLGVLALGLLLSNGNLGLADTATPNRVSFQIATGSTAGTYFPVGQAIAGLISHPPGVGRCDTAMVCGPAGLILSARSSAGSLENLRMVNEGTVDSAFAQGDVIAREVAGRGVLRGKPLDHIRVIAALFPEPLHLVAKPGIRTVADLRGKRVLLGAEGSGTSVMAHQVLAAFHVPERSLKIVRAETGNEGVLMQGGKIDAYFTVAGVPLDSVKDALAHGAHLVPVDGEGRDRLLKSVPQLSPMTIAGVYPGAPVETVAARAWWVTRDSVPDALVYGITRALFNPANRAALAASHFSARDIVLNTAAVNPPAPLHQGAARFYREAGKLPRS